MWDVREGLGRGWITKEDLSLISHQSNFLKILRNDDSKVMTIVVLLKMKMLGTYMWPTRIGFKSELIQDPLSLMTLSQPMVLIHCFAGCVILKMDPASEKILRNGCCAFLVAREQFFSTLYLT
jgi:hypothetical protein